jgi:hypothetical protein
LHFRHLSSNHWDIVFAKPPLISLNTLFHLLGFQTVGI